jgi:hypothetical protein
VGRFENEPDDGPRRPPAKEESFGHPTTDDGHGIKTPGPQVTGSHLTTLADFIREISKLDLRVTPDQRAELLRRSEQSIEASTAILASRGYVEFPDGHWGWFDPNQIQ